MSGVSIIRVGCAGLAVLLAMSLFDRSSPGEGTSTAAENGIDMRVGAVGDSPAGSEIVHVRETVRSARLQRPPGSGPFDPGDVVKAPYTEISENGILVGLDSDDELAQNEVDAMFVEMLGAFDAGWSE